MVFGTSAAAEQLESLILMYCRDTTDVATNHLTRTVESQEVSRGLYDDYRSQPGDVGSNEFT